MIQKNNLSSKWGAGARALRAPGRYATDIAGLIILLVLKTNFPLIMHFAKPRVYRANRHPGHRNRR